MPKAAAVGMDQRQLGRALARLLVRVRAEGDPLAVGRPDGVIPARDALGGQALRRAPLRRDDEEGEADLVRAASDTGSDLAKDARQNAWACAPQ